jgi:hypothetical protein
LEVVFWLISQNFVRQVKSCRHTVFRIKNYHSISPTFCRELCPFEVR